MDKETTAGLGAVAGQVERPVRPSGQDLTESQITQVCHALVRARDGYVSECATGLPCLPSWRAETLEMLNAALNTMAWVKRGA